jgi:hypothetical protein
MKRAVVICLLAVALPGLGGVGQAKNPIGQFAADCPVKPFVAMSIKPDELDLGQVPASSAGGLSGKLTAHIVANCPYHVQASFAPFTGQGGPILPKHTSLVINGKNVAAGGKAVSVTSSSKPTPVSGVDVPVDLKVTVKSVPLYRAGTYKGTITFTITPGP